MFLCGNDSQVAGEVWGGFLLTCHYADSCLVERQTLSPLFPWRLLSLLIDALADEARTLPSAHLGTLLGFPNTGATPSASALI